MIDLSITRDPKWIKAREKLWKPISKYLKDGLRNDELEKVHKYFMMGDRKELDSFGVDADAAAFCWFPIQNPEAWDYLFQNVIKDQKYFEYFFYFSFEDLTHRALSAEQQLVMWDYFAGNVFQPVVTSRVPVGKKGELVNFNVDKGRITASFYCFIHDWASSKKDHSNYKMIHRINYLITLLPYMSDQEFEVKDNFGNLVSQAAFCLREIFIRVCFPHYKIKKKLDGEKLVIFETFILSLKEKLDSAEMPVAMRKLWEEIKADKL
ncbi:MAG: hypothetical protein IPK77_05575 [Cellvibrio sp.]|nr:hypothetical protein [Cellvibrio sp.]